jgi:O-antigen ligase
MNDGFFDRDRPTNGPVSPQMHADLRPGTPIHDRVNLVYLALLYAMLGLGGSVFSILVIGALSFCMIKLLAGRLSPSSDPMARSMALAGGLYFLTGAAMALFQPDGGNLSLLWERAPFLGFLPLFSQLVLSGRDTLREGLETGALIGAIGLGIWVAVELVLFPDAVSGVRAHGPSGNPGPLATTAALLFAASLFAVIHNTGRRRLLAMIATVCAALTVGLSGMRTLLPALVLIPLLCLVAFPQMRKAAARPLNLALLAASLALFVAIAGSLIADRIGVSVDYLAGNGLQPSGTDSLGQRIAMWSCAWDAFQTAPLFGLGRSDALDFMTGCTLDLTGHGLSYSHFHNAIFTSLAFGGLVELAATLLLLLVPAFWAWRHRADPEARYGCALIAAILIVFGLNGVANIMLDHDIHDALFIHATTLALAMMAKKTAPAPTTATSDGA